MPLYEYQCIPNKHRFETRHGMNEEPVKECPQCGAPVRRVIHPVGIVFKGSGFYVNDSRKSSSAGKPNEGSGADSKTGDSPASDGDSKAASTETPKPAASGDAVSGSTSEPKSGKAAAT